MIIYRRSEGDFKNAKATLDARRSTSEKKTYVAKK